MKKSAIILSIFSITVLFAMTLNSCKKEKPQTAPGILVQEPNLPEEGYKYFDKHGVNNNIATLGRVLFYDENLSVNNAVSCGSCHKQEFAFADNVRVNKGFNGLDLKRNSPSIQGIRGFFSKNISFNQTNGEIEVSPEDAIPNRDNQADVLLFWDGRQKSVADMVLNPVLNHNEMNISDFETLINKINSISYYPALFAKAFGSEEVTKEKIAYALQGFIACLNTDKNSIPVNNGGMNGEFESNGGFGNNGFFGNNGGGFNTFPSNTTSTLTGIEEEGRILFHTKYNCAKCHDSNPQDPGGYGVVTSPSQMFNIGLDEVYTDNGLGAITKKAGDKGLFKVPTLKNISVTGPYMHDGRFNNLGEVIDHYSHNIKPNNNLSGLFRNFDGTPKKLNIIPAEKAALIAFLNTLRDEDFLTSPMYSDPFKK